ncbi:TIGR03915 family putative DNA repair protein [Bacillota bacterium LX-D]|nr:TIGR03915 family putative DNA repair protein [Bacillota bacterium LX-D]
MLYFTFDGTFPGLLTAIYESYYQPEKPDGITVQGQLELSLFDSAIHIKTDEAKAQKVLAAVSSKISAAALSNIYYAYLAEHPEAPTAIYKYLQLGFKRGEKIDLDLARQDVFTVHTLGQKVRRERHRYLGLLRFVKLQGEIYYAQFEPEGNIVSILAPHFAKRFADQKWIIHDLQRNLAAVYQPREWYLAELPPLPVTDLTGQAPQNKNFSRLWQSYFESIAVPNRTNPKLQMQNMPKKYWKYLTEKIDK